MKRHLVPTLAALIAAAVTTAFASAAKDDDNGKRGVQSASPYAVGLWGDLPYSDEQETTGVPNLIADMNSQKLAFSVHDGDLKSGGSECADDVYTQAVAYFNSLEAPAAFTPGDNDWTDCDRTAGYSSRERLDHERAVFFSTPYTLGERRLRQQVQTERICLGVSGPVPCVENRRWTYGRVTYATLNVQGSCNNRCDVAPDEPEFAARNTATIKWLRETFAHARSRGSAAVMLVFQANPGWDRSDPTRTTTRNPNTLVQDDPRPQNRPDGFEEFLKALREETIAFRRPVAAVQGDSHYFRVDKPLLDSQGRRVENFTRVETFGDNPQNGNNDVQWVRVDVDPRSREVFSYQPQIVPGNRTAVPAP